MCAIMPAKDKDAPMNRHLRIKPRRAHTQEGLIIGPEVSRSLSDSIFGAGMFNQRKVVIVNPTFVEKAPDSSSTDAALRLATLIYCRSLYAWQMRNQHGDVPQ